MTKCGWSTTPNSFPVRYPKLRVVPRVQKTRACGNGHQPCYYRRMSGILLAGFLLTVGPADASAAAPTEIPAMSTEAIAPEGRERRRHARPRKPGFSDPFAGSRARQAPVFGDPFATPEARHRPYEAQNVHAQFDDTPRRWRRNRARCCGGFGWGFAAGLGSWAPYGYWGPYGGWSYGYPYAGYGWGTGVGVGVGVGLLGVGIGLSALFF